MPENNEKPTGMIGAIWDTITAFFTAQAQSTWTGILPAFDIMAGKSVEKVIGFLDQMEEPQWRAMLDMFVDAGMLAPEDAVRLMELRKASPPLDMVAYFYTLFSLSKNYMDTVLYSASGTMRQELAKRYSPEAPPPREVLMAAFVAPEKTGEVRDAMKRGGLSDEDIDLMFLASYRLYTEMDIRNLWLRGVLNEDQMFMRMRELGYTDTRIKEIIQGWPVIPGAMDLFTMVAHEAFEPDAIALMGLADEFPEDQVEWLLKQGISREWALRYWYSHWDQPSIGMGYEMLHRGVIDLDTLDMLYRTVEIPPFWRDKLTKIAYNPYTRVDVRRMHDLGILSDDELIKSYKDLGYDDEHALNMARFTVQYNREHDKELTKSQIISGYNDKLITREDASTLIQDLDYSEAQTEYLLTLEDYKEVKEVQDMMVKNIQGRFENNYINEFEARDKLGQMNLSALKIDTMIEKWKISVFDDQKLPSKTDLDKLYLAQIIDEETWRDEMRKLGWGHVYVGWYFNLVSMKKAVK